MSENFTFVRRTGRANSRAEVEFAAKKDQIQHFEIILNTPWCIMKTSRLRLVWLNSALNKDSGAKKIEIKYNFL